MKGGTGNLLYMAQQLGDKWYKLPGASGGSPGIYPRAGNPRRPPDQLVHIWI